MPINTLGRCILKSADHPHGMTLDWVEDDTVLAWNNMMANIMHQFGLPGDRYVTEANVNNMTFWFRDHRDALLFRLCHGNSRLRQA